MENTNKFSASEFIYWFFNGRKPKPGKKERGFLWLKRAIGPKRSRIEEARYWDIEDLLREADRALTALAEKEDKDFYKGIENNAYAYRRSEWADMRLFGPYIPAKESLAYAPNIEMIYGLPDFAFIGVDATGIAEKEKSGEFSDYNFIQSRRITHLPNTCGCDALGVPYEVCSIGKTHRGLYGKRHFYVISNDGIVHPVRIKQSHIQSIRKRNSSKNINRVYWQEDLWGPSSERYGKHPDWGAFALTLTVNFYQQIESNWYIRVSDKRGVVNMSVTPQEVVYLFRDRKKIVTTPTGKRKPIMHWVKAHTRATGANVKTHLRGARRFIWNDLDVEIILPGKHRQRLTEMESVADSGFRNVPWFFRKLGNYASEKYIERTHQEDRIKGKEMTLKNPVTGEVIEVVGVDDKSQLKSESPRVLH